MAKERSRSVDLVFKHDISIHELFEMIKTAKTLKDIESDIEAVHKNGARSFTITLKNDLQNDTREYLLKKVGRELNTDKYGTFVGREIGTEKLDAFIKIPFSSNVEVFVRAVPAEIGNEAVQRLFKTIDCGEIKRVRKMNHRGLQIHNGYRAIKIKNYKVGTLPNFVNIGGYSCKIFPPMTSNVCWKCLEKGHLKQDCKNEVTCYYCNRNGHKRVNCPKRYEDYPRLIKMKVDPTKTV